MMVSSPNDLRSMTDSVAPAGAEEALTLVLTTLPDADAAGRLVSALVAERLIACGNIVPGLTSLYRWEGEVVEEAEVLVLMKTTSTRLEALFDRVGELHPYTVPELVEVPAGRVSRAYLSWVFESTEVIA